MKSVAPLASLKTRLAVLMTLLVTITLAGVTLLTLRASRQALADQVGVMLEAEAALLNNLFTQFFQEKIGHLQTLALSDALTASVVRRNASYPGTPADAAAEIARLNALWIAAADDDPLILGTISPERNPAAAQLLTFLREFGEHSEVFLTDRHGGTIAATGRLTDYEQADEDWWQAAWANGAGGIYISEPANDPSANVQALKLAVPLRAPGTGEVVGVLRSTLNVDRLFQIVERWSIGETGQARLLNGKGEVLAAADAATTARRSDGLPKDLLKQVAQQDSGYVVLRDEDGTESLFGFAAVRETNTRDSIAPALDRLAWVAVAQQKSSEALESAGSVLRASVIAGAVAVLLAAAAGFLVARAITQPLIELGAAADQVGNGNFEARMPVSTSAELHALIRSFSEMTARLRAQRAEILQGVQALREQAGEIHQVIGVLAPAADGILRSSNHVAANAEQTADAISGTMTSVAELRQTAHRATETAREMAETARHAAHISTAGKEATEASAAGMTRIRLQMESIGRSMLQLGEHTQTIGAIIAAVDDLAQSSTLLAVNAAIEAARAGEQGKGFAVVAQEVKVLADESRQATTQVRRILHDVQQATSGAMFATEQGAKAVEAGTEQSNQAGEAIVKLADTFSQAAEAAAQIAASAHQQLTGIAQVAEAMESMKDASAQNVGSAQQLEQAARELTALGRKLGALVERHQ